MTNLRNSPIDWWDIYVCCPEINVDIFVINLEIVPIRLVCSWLCVLNRTDGGPDEAFKGRNWWPYWSSTTQFSSGPLPHPLIPLYHDPHQSRWSIMTLSNTIYSVFSFIGFLFCAIPFTWHLKRKVEPLLRFLHSQWLKWILCSQIGTPEPAFSWLGQGFPASTSSLTLSFGMVISSTGVQCGVTSVQLILTWSSTVNYII
jgi:hypothetical protein